MSEQGEKPEVLPGDLITRPGLYESRGGDIVPITGWKDGWWITEYDGTLDWYGSDGSRRFYEGPDADRWQLLHWIGPLPASEPEPETTTEQLAEIEGQQEPIQVREGRWKTRNGDVRNVTPTPEGDGRKHFYPWWDAQRFETWTSDGCHYFGKASPLDLFEYLGPIEQQPQAVQVREGLWRQADGGAVVVRPTSDSPGNSLNRDRGYVWSDGARLYLDNGRHSEHKTTEYDLVEYLGPIQRQSEPQPVPIQVREGRWKTRAGEIVSVSAMPTDDDNFSPAYPWWDGDVATWADDGVFFSGYTADKDLVEYLGPIEQPEPQPEPVPNAAAIEELRSEVSYVQRLLGESRQRVTQLEELVTSLRTINEASEKAFEAAGKQNDALRLQVENRQQEYDRQKGRIEFLETLDAGNALAICDYRAKVEKLQGLVDTARGQLEAAATERDELRAAIDQADKQLDQKDAQIRDLRIELDAAQQVPQPVSDEERERIWDDATEQAGRQVIRWLRPLTLALNRQPDERFRSFMVLTLSVLPSIVPELLGYAVENEVDCEE